MKLAEKYHKLVNKQLEVALVKELLSKLSKESINTTYLEYVKSEYVEIGELLDNVIYIEDSKELINDIFKNIHLFSDIEA